MLRDKGTDGGFSRHPEAHDEAPYDDAMAGICDADLDLADEDDLPSDEGTRSLDDLEGESFSLGGADADFPDQSPMGHDGIESTFRLVVTGDRCRLEIPKWARGRMMEDASDDSLKEPFDRLTSFQRIAAWLMDERKEFLRDPQPWNLGAGAYKELKAKTPSVTEDGFLKLLDMESVQLNRHKRHCTLVWEDGTLPLDRLFSQEAKRAWVANALIQRYRELDDPITKKSLDGVTDLTLPKQSVAKLGRLGGNLNVLSFQEYIQRACLEVGVPWSTVLENHHDDILKAFR